MLATQRSWLAMDETKEPPPFGYTFDSFDSFEGELFQDPPHAFSNGGQNLLNENENRTLLDFFSNTNYFLPDTSASITPAQDTKDLFEHFDWGDPVPPASVHQISTIADQSQLHRGFHTEFALPSGHHQQPLSAGPFSTNTNHSHAASAHFPNDTVQAQTSQSNSRSYSVPNNHLSLPLSNQVPNQVPPAFGTMPMIPTPHGMMNEQLANLIPNHSENGSVDEDMAARFSHTHVNLGQRRHSLKRTYVYGTDNDFNATGYSAPASQVDDTAHQRLVHSLGMAQPLLSAPNGENSPRATGHFTFPATDTLQDGSHDAELSLDSNHCDENRATKKRRKTKDDGTKSTSDAPQRKVPKTSVDTQLAKKKRASVAKHKPQKTNLSEAQKRNNHILSEQKRRNLIKRGFDDLHEVVPEIRNGGFSKSVVLIEAGNFLEQMKLDNTRYSALFGFKCD